MQHKEGCDDVVSYHAVLVGQESVPVPSLSRKESRGKDAASAGQRTPKPTCRLVHTSGGRAEVAMRGSPRQLTRQRRGSIV